MTSETIAIILVITPIIVIGSAIIIIIIIIIIGPIIAIIISILRSSSGSSLPLPNMDYLYMYPLIRLRGLLIALVLLAFSFFLFRPLRLT